MGYRIGIAGATGLVGRTMIRVLEERKFPVDQLRLFASAGSAGSVLNFAGKDIKVEELKDDSFEGLDFCLFSAGGEISKQYAPHCARYNCIAIDNSSAWRMDPRVPLIVPEVNPEVLRRHKNIIANPNCSTIQLVVALKPIFDKYGLKRVVCSTYQSISGAGQKGIDKLNDEISGIPTGDKHRIAFNWMFHPISESDGFTVEENKMWNETRKILDKEDMNIAITCVRLPIVGAHGESVNIELDSDFDMDSIRKLLIEFPGLSVIDDMTNEDYATPDLARDRDGVFISRLHRDHSVPYGFYMWVTADNLRKGAATNAVQIAEKIIEMKLR